jgi:hypothetical protein
MRGITKRNKKGVRRLQRCSGFVLAIMVTLGAIAGMGGNTLAQHGQQGVTKTTCHAENIYIYKAPTTQSDRRGQMGRGWLFRVYHYVNDIWAFGVHNSSGVSGYVLREKLCN